MQPPAEGLASRLFLVPALRTQPDRRLVALVREGYETAFEEIVGRYGTPLSRYAASIVGDRSDDVLQDAFSKALLALRRDDAESRPRRGNRRPGGRVEAQQRHGDLREGRAGQLSYLASSQSAPTPMSTSSGGSSW